MSASGKNVTRNGNISNVWLLLVLIAVAAVGPTYTLPAHSTGHSFAAYSSAAVSSDGTPCAQISVDVLKAGGKAADGAIAAMLCTGIVNPHSMGLGGGFLLTYYDKSEQKAYTLNARETAVAAADEDMFHGDPVLSTRGGLAVAIPGQVRGYVALYERFGGGVPWADLFTHPISLAEDGYPVCWHLAFALDMYADEILNEPSLSMFVNSETGKVLQEGDILKMPLLAATMRVLQEEPDALYTGSLAEEFISDLNTFDGIMTLEDLEDFKVEWEEPIKISFEHRIIPQTTLYSSPLPGTGSVLGFILNVLDEYNFDESDMDPENQLLTYQRMTEAFKYGYALRTYLGDIQSDEMNELEANMTSEVMARSIKNIILQDSTSQDREYYGAYTEDVKDHGTSQFSVLSAEGDAVSVTSTINSYFGAMIASTKTGIIYNDEMDDFSSPNITNHFGVPPSPANFIRPGKRPLSSTCPTVLVSKNGEVRMVIGGAGGTHITTAVALSLINNLWFGMNIEDAITAPRIHHQLDPMVLGYEEEFSKTVLEGLESFGHETEEFPVTKSVVCGVVREDDGYIYAATDFRKSGQVDGY